MAKGVNTTPVAIFDVDGVSRVPISSSTPAGTEMGMYVRVVSQPAGGAGGGPATIADGADVAEGATTDAAVISDASGTVSAKLRGLVKMLADVWDSVNHRLNANITNASIAVTGTFFQTTQPVKFSQSGSDNDVDVLTLPAITGTVTANAGTNLNTSALALEAGGNLAAIKTDVDKIPSDPAREGGNLLTLAGKDFATQATLALIKAKTDNLDVLLSSRTKPADQQHVIVDSSQLPTGAATDANLNALFGTTDTKPPANTMLDRLYQLGLKIDNHAKVGASETTLRTLVAALSKPVARPYTTLLHRS